MLAQYVVSLGVTTSQNPKRRSDKNVNSLKTSKEMIFHVHMLEERLCIVFQKHVLRQYLKLMLVLNLLLMFHQISSSCSYRKSVLQISVWQMCPYLAWRISLGAP